MTANQLKEEVLLLYDRLFEFSAPHYDDKKISEMLTLAQDNVVKNIIRDKKGFESTELKKAITTQLNSRGSLGEGDITLSADQTYAHPNGLIYDMPDNLFIISSESVEYNGISKLATVQPKTYDFYSRNINNPYKKPSTEVVWRLDMSRVDHGEDGGDSFTGRTSKRVELITDGTIVVDYIVDYLKYPTEIVCDVFTPSNQRHCILDDMIHHDIVREAVRLMYAASKPSEYQIAATEMKNNEN